MRVSARPVPMNVGRDDCEDDQALQQIHDRRVMQVTGSRFVAH
jgi:hypothetical protein